MESPDWQVADEQLRISITCSQCSALSTGVPVWYRCDPKAAENVNFEVKEGQVEAGAGF